MVIFYSWYIAHIFSYSLISSSIYLIWLSIASIPMFEFLKFFSNFFSLFSSCFISIPISWIESISSYCSLSFYKFWLLFSRCYFCFTVNFFCTSYDFIFKLPLDDRRGFYLKWRRPRNLYYSGMDFDEFRIILLTLSISDSNYLKWAIRFWYWRISWMSSDLRVRSDELFLLVLEYL